MKLKIVIFSILILSLGGIYTVAQATHSSCHYYTGDSFHLCFYDWLAQYHGWRGGALDSYLTQIANITLPTEQLGSYFVDFESVFSIRDWHFDHPYVLGGERCARSRWSASEGSILYTCADGVYVRGEFRGLVNLKPGQYQFHLFNNDGAALYVYPFGWIINNINHSGPGTQFDSATYTIPGGYTNIAVFYNLRTNTYYANPWPGEQPRLRLWWENTNEKSLLVTVNGGGKIVGQGIDCGSDCTESYNAGTPVTLSVAPTAGYGFVGWGGDCTGVGSCELIMDADKSAIANFAQNFSLNVSKSGTGNGVVIGPGIDCGTDCSESYDSGSSLSISVNPDPGSLFGGWSGDCSGFGDCSLTMDSNKSVTAIFERSNFQPSLEPGGLKEVRP